MPHFLTTRGDLELGVYRSKSYTSTYLKVHVTVNKVPVNGEFGTGSVSRNSAITR